MGLRDRIIRRLDEGRYKEFPSRWDDLRFSELIASRVMPTHTVLDLGAGAGIVPEMNFKELAARVCGVDPDPRVVNNPYLHEGRQGVGEQIPYDDQTFDVVFCDNVLEHLENPETVFAEVRRVLKPGGVFLAKTPNYWHYVAVTASVTPLSFHQRFNAARGRKEEDTFPTVYRANTRRDLLKLASKTGMELVDCTRIEGRPEYLRRWASTYIAGTVYERIVNASEILAPFRVVLFAELKRVG
ncbi:MAG: class I SAM-dependent methyltransferase [Myxococcota bacterium]